MPGRISANARRLLSIARCNLEFKMTKKPTLPRKPHGISAQHRWHLAVDDFGIAITDLEYALMRVYQSFSRWQSGCMAGVTGINLSGQENALLHVVRMHDRAKTIKELMHLTNRQDTANVQYELRKLIKAELIEKYGTARSGIYYVATAEGVRVCDEYAELRSQTLLEAARAVPGLEDFALAAAAGLDQLEKVYESSTREVATFHQHR